MKLDELYFTVKLNTMIVDLNLERMTAILHEIARDAAQAQRDGCWNWCGGSGCPTCAAKLEIPHA